MKTGNETHELKAMEIVNWLIRPLPRDNHIRLHYRKRRMGIKTKCEFLLFTLLPLAYFELKNQSIMEIKKEQTIETSTAAVWDVLTKPEYIKIWLGVEVESDWRINSAILFRFSWDGKGFVDKGKIIGLDKNKLFAYTYWSNFSGLIDEPGNYSKVKFELEEKGGHTSLKLVHSKIKNQTMYVHADKNWEGTLNEIKSLSESIKKK
ncbi:SRPBCC domain-containing protein [Flagellimonas olearia]|uniref:SRPBCC domain-containing protein n=1 Tax=Flagellimonas olearia TaxID=552546 RepID=A0A6I1DZG2_9FLAO|nr:SRPBCC family protein [Allomuricauda olearia]KAB7530237.1 SRPBCC domain-containing protein [Allomuricauda olearia]